ncbi:MAG: membrane protein insertion efficiency factor YidD [Thermodesulfobacteriota bacterium]|nr:membrane protein insertion efficiency factor YidD [Thermodesulfobacteriota bacterium]
MKGPWQSPQARASFAKPTAKATHGPAFLIGLYREYVSPIDGSQCPMVPSCSQYSLDAFEKHGLFMGWIMTCDRLLRCGRDEIKRSSRIVVMGEEKCYDPVENNDFWWSTHR